MTALGVVIERLASWPAPRQSGDRVIVPTHCLHSSGSVVRVVVEGRSSEFIVHDDGGAIDELSGAGGVNPRAANALRSHFGGQGIHIGSRGEIRSPKVSAAELASAIVLIANASREGADLLLSKWKPRVRRNFKLLLQAILDAEFPNVRHEFKVIGQSQKQHKFDFAIPGEGGKLLLVDAVSFDANAISSAVIRNMDVGRNAHGDQVIEQRIVYDDEDDWQAPDMALLNMSGAKAVALSRAGEVFTRLAA